MNINYADIITKANTRKIALEKLTYELTDLEEHSHALLGSLYYFKGLNKVVAGLDDEGRDLLPHTMVTRIQKLAEVCDHLYMQLRNDRSYAHLDELSKLAHPQD